jgi:L,D-peptidoglycan transpeptidase YkuD (ErfK/YbiS/YcfS/YnhG family)
MGVDRRSERAPSWLNPFGIVIGSGVDRNRPPAQEALVGVANVGTGGLGRNRTIERLLVVATGAGRQRGIISGGGFAAPCALGRSGTRSLKREGDGATPRGRFGLAAVLYRPDRWRRPASRLPVTAIGPQDGWCDDPADRRYNQPVELPCAGRHENLWRADHLYDVVVVIDFNLARPQPGRGSAIFLHIAADDFHPTEGCVAIRAAAMQQLLPRIGPATTIEIR